MPFIRTARPIHPMVRAYLKRRGMGQDTSVNLPTDTFGSITDTSGNTYATIPDVFSGSPGVSSSSPSSLTSFLQAIPGLATTGLNIFQRVQGPSLVPGTQAIYNPSTGQYYNPSTGQVVNPTGATLGTSPIASSIPLLLIGGGVILVAALFMGGRR